MNPKNNSDQNTNVANTSNIGSLTSESTNTTQNTPLIPPIEEAPHTPEHAVPIVNSVTTTALPPPPTPPTSPIFDQTPASDPPPSVDTKSKFNKKIITAIAVVVFLVISIPVGIFLVNQSQNITEKAAPSQTYDIGYYINLAGGGSDPNGNIGAYNDEADCQPANGVCFARNRQTGQSYPDGHVQKYICQGKFTNCDNTNAPGKVIKGPDYSTVHYIKDINYPPIQCDQTIQLDVFDKVNGTLKGFMVWYSGACSTASSPNPSPSPRVSPTPTTSPVLSPTPVSSPISSPRISPSPSPSISPTPVQSPVGGIASPVPTPTPKSSPKPTSPTPTPEALPVSGTISHGIIAAAGGLMLLLAGMLLAF